MGKSRNSYSPPNMISNKSIQEQLTVQSPINLQNQEIMVRFIYKSFVYVFYVLLTLDARNRWMAGKAKGSHCHKITSGMGTFTNHYQAGKKPVREYMTWKEFRKKHNF